MLPAINTAILIILKNFNESLIYLPASLPKSTCPTQAGTPHWALGAYLYYPNESFQLVDVELQVHAVCQPSAHNTHGAGVPLLQERQTSPAPTAGLCAMPWLTLVPPASPHTHLCHLPARSWRAQTERGDRHLLLHRISMQELLNFNNKTINLLGGYQYQLPPVVAQGFVIVFCHWWQLPAVTCV